jgi:hypothetical protein
MRVLHDDIDAIILKYNNGNCDFSGVEDEAMIQRAKTAAWGAMRRDHRWRGGHDMKSLRLAETVYNKQKDLDRKVTDEEFQEICLSCKYGD